MKKVNNMLLIADGSAPMEIRECLYSTYTSFPVSKWAMWAMLGGKKEDARQARFVSLPNQGSGVG